VNFRQGGRWETIQLYCWLRPQKSSSAEIDFVVAAGGRVVPIEVKSGPSGRLGSLHLLLAEYPQCAPGLVLSEAPYAELPGQGITFVPLCYAWECSHGAHVLRQSHAGWSLELTLSAGPVLWGIDELRAMPNRHDPHRMDLRLVEEPIRHHDDLAEGEGRILRQSASGIWEVAQPGQRVQSLVPEGDCRRRAVRRRWR